MTQVEIPMIPFDRENVTEVKESNVPEITYGGGNTPTPMTDCNPRSEFLFINQYLKKVHPKQSTTCDLIPTQHKTKKGNRKFRLKVYKFDPVHGKGELLRETIAYEFISKAQQRPYYKVLHRTN
jgi:hypothetical protein